MSKRLWQTEHTQEYRARKRENGICVYGGCWLKVGPSSISHCEQHNKQQKEWRRKRLERGQK